MKPWMREALDIAALDAPAGYPRDLVDELPLYLPLDVVALPALTVRTIDAWLSVRGLGTIHTTAQRELHGCLVASAGKGLIFVDAADDENEQRFTVAHEAAHFVLEYVVPRQRAVEHFGPAIGDVLDGKRGASVAERLSAVLDKVPIGLRVHLMERSASGSVCRWDVQEAEDQADRLALELLAPEKEVRRALQASAVVAVEDAAVLLEQRFGLPPHGARAYVQLLMPAAKTPKKKLSEELFGGKR